MSDNVSSLDLAISQVDNTFQSTDTIRDSIIAKLQNTINDLQILPEDDSPKKLEAKMAIIQTMAGLLKDKESGSVTVAKVKMQKKDTESSDAARKMAIELLKSINVKAATAVGATVVPGDIDKKVDMAIESTHRTIEDSELVGNGLDEPAK